jgi:hypothetical protein
MGKERRQMGKDRKRFPSGSSKDRRRITNNISRQSSTRGSKRFPNVEVN